MPCVPVAVTWAAVFEQASRCQQQTQFRDAFSAFFLFVCLIDFFFCYFAKNLKVVNEYKAQTPN